MATFGEARRRFEELRKHPGEVEAVLAAGAGKARAIAGPLMDEVRAAVGIK